MSSIEHAALDLTVTPAAPYAKRAASRLRVCQILAFTAITLLSACSGSDSPTPPKEPELKEIPTTETPLSEDASEPELMFRGKRYFETRVFGEAKKAFQTITSNYPLGPYAEFASVKYADTVFELQDYGAAAGLYEELYKNHPGSEFAPYAVFRAARSYQLAQRGVGRDDTALQKSAKLYDELLAKHPDSFYARAGKGYRDDAHRDLAQYEEEVAAFYRKRDKPKAAEARQLSFQQKWEPILADAANQSSQKPSEERAALERIAAELNSTRPAATPSQVIAKQGPGGTASKVSIPSKVSIRGAEVTEPDPLNTASTNNPALRAAAHFVSKLECIQNSGTQLTLFVDSEIPEDKIPQPQTVVANGGESYLSVKLPNTAAQVMSQRCPDGTEVLISPDGELRIKGGGQLSILTLSNPPRVLVMLP
jgi:outer membrane assembly lipoprotein YfiO